MHVANYKKIFHRIEKWFGFETEIKWGSAMLIISYHILAVFWCYHYAIPAKWQTVSFAVFMCVVSALGITCGVHRYWTHRCYKATRPLQMLLLFMFSCASQTSVRLWVRNHRLHHKSSDTSADPHNVNRGLFYAHIGWLMMKKHPEALRKGKTIDMSDINNDPLLEWHEKHMINPICCFVIPTLVGMWLWGEVWQTAMAWQWFIRYAFVFHSEFTVNSLAHAYGYRPYIKDIAPVEAWYLSVPTLGESWHNYHHAFPFDYKAAEYCDLFNLSTAFIRLCHRIGWAYDLKEASPATVKALSERLGDVNRYKTDGTQI